MSVWSCELELVTGTIKSVSWSRLILAGKTKAKCSPGSRGSLGCSGFAARPCCLPLCTQEIWSLHNAEASKDRKLRRTEPCKFCLLRSPACLWSSGGKCRLPQVSLWASGFCAVLRKAVRPAHRAGVPALSLPSVAIKRQEPERCTISRAIRESN